MASTDRNVLLGLYHSNGGAGWRTNVNWDTDADLSWWNCVEVNDQGRVVGLNLYKEGLRGIVCLYTAHLADVSCVLPCYHALDLPQNELVNRRYRS